MRARLWSLWELAQAMKPFDPSDLAHLAELMGRQNEWNRPSGPFTAPGGWANARDEFLDEHWAKFVDEQFSRWETSTVELELDAVAATIQKIRGRLNRHWRHRDVWEFADELTGRLYDQMRQRRYLALSVAEARHFDRPSDGWADVPAKFESAIYEIEECTKCLIFDRSTAAAFHAIRCLEAGIGALSRCLDIPDPTKASGRSWMKLLDALREGIDVRWPTSSHRMKGDGEFFDNAYAALAAMQNPWRNATMHLDQKYTLEEARHICDVVRGFMIRVSSRMDENGLPRA